MNEVRIQRLLAMRHAAGFGWSALVRRLNEGGILEDVLEDPRWKPTSISWRQAERQQLAISFLGLRVVPVWELPVFLRQYSPPLALFVRGNSDLLYEMGCGVVGSRDASEQGLTWASHRATEVVQKGEVVISGGALGIDAAAHVAALGAGGRTLVYLGVAADRIYPLRHRPLFARVLAQGGALVSEHPPLAYTAAYEHARRNRLIVGHSRRLLIAEARIDSGTLKTANIACRLNKPVYIPKPRSVRNGAGLAALLRENKAKVWTSYMS
jgi:DNA processing protein